MLFRSYAVVRRPTVARYTVAQADRATGDGGPIVVRRLAKGRWQIRVTDLPSGGAAIVSPLGGRATCQIGSLPRTAKDLRMEVRCFSPAGTPADNRFIVSWGK